jgi:UDP-2,3-diacylglucosamine pyrophosphatase LpxH
MLEKLEQLLKQKKSQAYYATKLGITVEEVKELMKELRGQSTETATGFATTNLLSFYPNDLEQHVNNDKGTLSSTVVVDFEPKSDIELAELHKVDLTKYKISSYWTKQRGEKFTSSLLCTLIKKDSAEGFQNEFKEFLQTDVILPGLFTFKSFQDRKKPKVSLILPRQDAHFNKLDINGDNDIERRFLDDAFATNNFLKKAQATNYLEEIVYIVGSDQFNSEWTGLTTKGTPQSNILSYQEAFKIICEHEAAMLLALNQECDKLKIVFIPGNHDQYVGWHLINWLEAYLKNSGIIFESSTLNTKYHKFGNTGVMLNHGDAMKPAALAAKFPIGFKDQWSSCEHFIILTGDKHTELSMDFNGIKFYRVPQLSTSTSGWDDKNGYIDSKAESTAFVITEDNGVSDIYKEVIN